MTPRVRVVTELAGYRVAVAGLPIHAESAADPAGAIVVVDGAARWWDAAARAIDAGASAVLVDEPREVPLDAIARLADLASDAAAPIVVHRSRLRSDLVDLAVEHREGATPRVVVAECRATADGLAATVRDAVGWMRALAGTELTVASASSSADVGTALFRSRADDRVVGSMLSAVTHPEGALLRVQALGETTTEVEIDEPVGRCELSTSTVRGRLIAPSGFEAGDRAALRRAIDAVVEGRSPSELADLLHDAAAASASLRLRPDSSRFR